MSDKIQSVSMWHIINDEWFHIVQETTPEGITLFYTNGELTGKAELVDNKLIMVKNNEALGPTKKD